MNDQRSPLLKARLGAVREAIDADLKTLKERAAVGYGDAGSEDWKLIQLSVAGLVSNLIALNKETDALISTLESVEA